MGGDKNKNSDRNSAMKYNIFTSTWSDIADMNVPRRNAGNQFTLIHHLKLNQHFSVDK